MNEQTTPQPDPAPDRAPDPASDPTPEPAAPAAPAAAAAAAPPRPPLRDRVYGMRGVAAVGVAALVLGGLGGTALGFALDDDRPDHPARFGGPFRMQDGPGDWRQDRPDGFGPPGMPGPAPDTTSPEEEAEPDDSDESSGSNG